MHIYCTVLAVLFTCQPLLFAHVTDNLSNSEILFMLDIPPGEEPPPRQPHATLDMDR